MEDALSTYTLRLGPETKEAAACHFVRVHRYVRGHRCHVRERLSEGFGAQVVDRAGGIKRGSALRYAPPAQVGVPCYARCVVECFLRAPRGTLSRTEGAACSHFERRTAVRL